MDDRVPATWSEDAAVSHLMAADPILAEIIRRHGPCTIMLRPPTFETLARSITFQQLSGKAAKAIFDRVRSAMGRRFSAPAFLKLGDDELRACGLSRQKIASLRDLAGRVARREINFRNFAKMEDEDIIAALSEVRGVGVWTVQMFLMFSLGRPNVMPLGDLGIRNAVRKAYRLAEAPKSADLAAIARDWHPHCTLACWYLWRSLEGPAEF